MIELDNINTNDNSFIIKKMIREARDFLNVFILSICHFENKMELPTYPGLFMETQLAAYVDTEKKRLFFWVGMLNILHMKV